MTERLRDAAMAYRAGIAPNMVALGLEPGPPHVICDGCGVVHGCERRDGMPYRWFLDGKAPPGWAKRYDDHGKRWDYCRACRASLPRG